MASKAGSRRAGLGRSTDEIVPVSIVFPPELQDWVLGEIRAVLREGRLSSGPQVERFEAEFACYVEANAAVATSSGTTALEVAVRALAPAATGSVLVPANANFATYVAPVHAGLRVRLVDLEPGGLFPGPNELEKAWSSDCVGLILVHLGGHIPARMAGLVRWCEARSLWLLEDCAHAHGSRLAGRHAGRFGHAGAFSFFATKVLPAGEGGMLVTDDEQLAARFRVIRNLGKQRLFDNEYELLGLNARLSELNAILGRAQLRRLDDEIAARSRLADLYDERLADVERLAIVKRRHRVSGYKYMGMLAEGVSRHALRTALARRGIRLSGEIYETALHQQPALRGLHPEALPAVESYSLRHVCLPLHGRMSPEDVACVAIAVEEELTESGRVETRGD